jgi:DnaJ-class molecular chaperone
MDFGKRFSAHDDRPAAAGQQARAAQENCVRCFGTGRIRERGNRLVCKACAGTGRVTVKMERAS